MSKVGIVSLGCCKNLVDSEMILQFFVDSGYQITVDPKQADIIIVNTCGFILDAKKESIDTIFEMLTYHKKVIVTGCLAQRYYEILKKQIPEMDLLIKIDDYSHFKKMVQTIIPDLTNENEGLSYQKRTISTSDFSAYLKIGEGCSNNCTYCAIPLIRGPLHSRSIDDIYQEALNLANKGIKELVLIAQDTTKYGLDLYHQIKIEELLKKILTIKEFKYIRLLYLYPDEISDELIDLFKNEERLTPYFDIPIQHSESHILKDMNRRGDKQFLIDLFNKIKSRVPNAILRTTIMVGFPNETNDDIDQLINFMQEVEFDHLGAFSYSKEEDTPSYNFKGQISEKKKKERLDKVMKAQSHISYQKNKKHIGEIMNGLVIGKKGEFYLLRSYWNAPDDIDGQIMFTSHQKLSNGDYVKVKINNALIYDLSGELIEVIEKK